MTSINKAIIIGRVGKDPEVRYLSSGKAVTNLSVATTESWKDKEGNKQEATEWHRVVFYDKLAEIVGQYCKKGGLIYVEGKLKTKKWQDKEGRDCYTTEINADTMKLLGGNQEGKQEERKKPEPKRHGDRPGGAFNKPSTGFDDMDSDIPW